MKWILPILIGCCLACISPSLWCANPRPLFSMGVGIFDTLRDSRMVQFQVEYLWSACWYGLRPISSGMVTQQGSLYFCFGAAYEIYLGDRVILTPSFAPGIYLKNCGKDLGFPLEFRSALSLSYERRNHDRVGAQFYHISNASLGTKNPGEESLVFFYSFAM